MTMGLHQQELPSVIADLFVVVDGTVCVKRDDGMVGGNRTRQRGRLLRWRLQNC